MTKKCTTQAFEGLESSKMNPSKPEHNIVEMSEISRNSSSFQNCFPDGSPFFTWVEFSITDLCNRTCVFCPRFDPNVYPNNNEEISLGLYEKIMSELSYYDWEGGIIFSAFGEPFLHNNLLELVSMTKKYLPNSILEIVSNGDKLSVKKCSKLYEAGLDILKVSLYDGPHQLPEFEQMRREIGVDDRQFIMRNRYDKNEDYGLIMSNRAGSVTPTDVNLRKVILPLNKKCYFPFYKLLIDYDGRVLLCSHDWVKKLSGGDLKEKSIYEVWTGKIMTTVRNRLKHGDRRMNPCAKCDVDGTLNGVTEFQRWVKILNLDR